MNTTDNRTKSKRKKALAPVSQRHLDRTLSEVRTTHLEDREAASKSARKRQSLAIQTLGERLTRLPPDRLLQLPLDDSLRDALQEAASITNHEGRRRQLQYVGKLMRNANIELITEELDNHSQKNRTEIAVDHAAERWRERLLSDPLASEQWATSFPNAPLDRKSIALLSEPSSRDSIDGRKRYRDLFRSLKAALEVIASNQTQTHAEDDE